ncbi:TatD family hydrolase [Poriferisphaera sp. WC338]|uniref:TatD family hydrolase n=1 Tax=Poriferisphaera sp. WC338 TaxID=3425129 RepID=UPI003D818345
MKRYNIIDAHCHLQDGSFAKDRQQVIEHAEQVGVQYLVCNATSPEDWDEILGFTARYPHVIPALGLHPWFIDQAPDDWLIQLEKRIKLSNALIGEVGLDQWVKPRDEILQEGVFREQLRLAHKLEKSLSIHCLHAWDWLLEVLTDEDVPDRGFLLHGYAGPESMIPTLSELGGYFSFSANILDVSRTQLRRAIQVVPLDRLMIETDAPYLLPPDEYTHTPEHLEGRIRNEPAHLADFFPQLAQLLSVSPDKLASQLWDNATYLFDPWIKPVP